MRLTAADEFQHSPAGDWLWRESFYFNFHDASGLIGGMSTIGVRPNQDRFEGVAVIFFGIRSQVLFYHTEGSLKERGGGLFGVPGITCEIRTPLEKVRFAAEADFVSGNPDMMAQGVPLLRTVVPAGFDVTFDAFDAAHMFPPAYGLLAGPAAHYEQNGHVRGRVRVGGEGYYVEGLGCRDRTWGIRDLALTDQGGAIFAQFGPHLTVDTLWSQAGGQETAVGFISRQGVHSAVNASRLSLKTKPVSGLPKTLQAEIGLAGGGSLAVDGTILSVMPIISNHGGNTFYWYECLTRFWHGQDTGLGITEIAVWDRRSQKG